jgi:hypothetical protein
MLLLKLIRIVIKEGFIASHLIPDGHHTNLVDSLFDPH